MINRFPRAHRTTRCRWIRPIKAGPIHGPQVSAAEEILAACLLGFVPRK
jgi:hypothetical protein